MKKLIAAAMVAVLAAWTIACVPDEPVEPHCTDITSIETATKGIEFQAAKVRAEFSNDMDELGRQNACDGYNADVFAGGGDD